MARNTEALPIKKVRDTLCIIAMMLTTHSAFSKPTQIDPKLTEVYSPIPKKVTPYNHESIFRSAPSNAIVLFNGTHLDHWINANNQQKAGWPIINGVLQVDKKVGNIMTRAKFKNVQLHIEWLIPKQMSGEGQKRGNSGIFFNSRNGKNGYELQILDGFNNPTYVNGMVGSIYKQSAPLVNASLANGQWQSFDLTWLAPTFDHKGELKTPAKITAYHNGVLIQDNFELLGETTFRGQPKYTAHDDGRIMLQAHRDPSEPIYFRNIWLVELPEK